MLRDTLTPFRIELKITEQSISVPKVQDVLSTLLNRKQNEVEWNTMLPKIHETLSDVRKELENMLKKAISTLITIHKT